MNKEKLDALLANGSITQEEYDELLEKYGLNESEPPEPPTGSADDDDDLEARIEKLVQAKVDKITAKLGKEKSDLQKKLEKLKKEHLTDDQLKQDELNEKEKAIADREKALLEKENRLYAIKKIKAEGLDDGSDKSLELVDFVLSDDTDVIDSRVKAFSELVKKFVTDRVKKTFEDNGRNPNAGGKGSNTNNPYAKETWNFTEQNRLEIENPELAKTLKASAGVK